MKRLLATAAASLAAALITFGCANMPGSDSGWTTLIDGASGMENFTAIGEANWKAEGGAIWANSGKPGFLVSKQSYKDFQMRVEFWAEDTTNSGIFIRMKDRTKINAANSYEVNVFDQRPEPKYGTGAIVDVAAVNPMPKAGGKWNTYDITAKGSQLTVVLNGVKTVDVQDSKHAEGPFSLQYAMGAKDIQGGAIRFRKLQIRPL
jgi:hypothetical protein